MTTIGPLQDSTTRLVTPSSETQLSNVDEEKLVEALDAQDLDFGVEDDLSWTDQNNWDVFPVEDLTKMNTFTDLVNALPDEPRKAEDLIAEAMQSMSLKEREQVVRDLYGIEKASASTTATVSDVTRNVPVTSTEPDDDPQFLETKLHEMEQAIQLMKNNNLWSLKFAALELAESKDLAYTQNKKFRLLFLRCDRFDATKAASRFIRYFDWKLELFGEDALARDVVFSDLKKEDQASIKKGYLQRLPVRDRAGRAIFCGLQFGQMYDSPESVSRQWFYLFENIDDETNKKGQIAMFFKVKDTGFKKSNKAFGGQPYVFRFLGDYPTRFDALHKFREVEAGTMERIMNFAVGIMNPDVQARVKVHHGTFSEWMSELMSFGIPQDAIPCTPSFKIKNKNHLEYLAMRMRAEEILATTPGMTRDKLVDLPTRRDVLLGKGRPIQFSTGNQALAMVVEGYLDQYHKECNKAEKTALANEIIRTVKSNGVRFLSKDNGIWMEVSHEVARDKISHMFRHMKKKCSNSNGTTRATPEGSPSPQTESQEQNKRAKV